MTDDPPGPLDLTASDALDAGATDHLGPEARRRAEQFAEVRARLRDDADAPRGPQLDALVAEALRLAEAPRFGRTGEGPVRPGAPSRRRAPVAWLAAAALVVVVAAVAVVATVDRDDASEDAAVVLPAEADAPGATAKGTGAPSAAAEVDSSATEASPGAPTTAAAGAPAPGGSTDSGQLSPPTPEGGPATTPRVAAMAGARVTVVVTLR